MALRETIMNFIRVKGSAILLPLILIAFAAAVGIGASYFTKKDDGPVEEFAEAQIENEAEVVFNLPHGTMTGRIDLTPGSKET